MPSLPDNIVHLTKRTQDFLKSENLSRQLVRRIKAYYAKDNRTPNVWIEKQRLGVGDFVWVVRSDIVFTVPAA